MLTLTQLNDLVTALKEAPQMIRDIVLSELQDGETPTSSTPISASKTAPAARRRRPTDSLDREVLSLLARSKKRRSDLANELQRARSTISVTVAGLIEAGKVQDAGGGLLRLVRGKKTAVKAAGKLTKKRRGKGKKRQAPHVVRGDTRTLQERILSVLPTDPEAAIDIGRLSEAVGGNRTSVQATVYKAAADGLVLKPAPGRFCLSEAASGRA